MKFDNFRSFIRIFVPDSLAHVWVVGQDILRKDVYERYLLSSNLANLNTEKIRQRKRPHRAFIPLTYGRETLLCHAEQLGHAEQSEASQIP